MKTLSFFITALALGVAYQSDAQVLTTAEPATVTDGNRPLPGNPKSMTVADGGASSSYIIGKRVDPDKKKENVKSRAASPTDQPLKDRVDSTTRKNRATRKNGSVRKPNN